MIWLFAILILIIFIFEFLDEILTQIDLKKFGIDRESNKIIRKLEETTGEEGVFLYKLLSTIAFAVIGWFIYKTDPLYFYILAGIIIFLYAAVIVHNYRLSKKD